MAALGPSQVVAYARRFGLSDVDPTLPSAVGTSEATLLDVTSAYSAFVNHGVRMTPNSIVRITDREGNVLEENPPQPNEVIRADTAFVMTNLLRGVVQRGTASAAAELDWPLGGMAGTSSGFSDAWFVGFDPDITVGVWVGDNEGQSLGSGVTGAASALPIWIDFMRAYIDKRGDRTSPPQFEPPGNILFVTLDSGVTEAFINGTQPESAIRVSPGAARNSTPPSAGQPRNGLRRGQRTTR
jgi:penicillin-binding protein 1A